MNISCCFSSDDFYVPPLSALLISILDNARQEDYHSFYIFDGGISEVNKDYLSSLSKRWNCDIHFISVDSAFYKEFPLNRSHITVPTYFRLSLEHLLPETLDRILYLDCDMIVLTSLAPLYETPLEDHFAAMVSEPHRPQNQKYYFNAGMILFNVTKIRNSNFETKAFEYWREHRETIQDQDQGILNGLFDGNVVPLHLKWNMCIRPEAIHSYRHRQVFSSQEILEALSQPAIIHYLAKRKPWHLFCKHWKTEWYWKYAAKTPYYSRSWHWLCRLFNQTTLLQRRILFFRKDQRHIRFVIFGKEFVWFNEKKIAENSKK